MIGPVATHITHGNSAVEASDPLMRLVPAIVIALAIVLAPVLWVVLPRVLSGDEAGLGPAIDSGARIVGFAHGGRSRALRRCP